MSRGGSFLDKLLFGYRTIQWNGVSLPPETTVNFVGSPLVIDNPSQGRTDVTVGSGGGAGGLQLVQNNGAALPFEPVLNFVGFTLADDPGNSRTNIGGGGGLPLGTGIVQVVSGVGSTLSQPTSTDTSLTWNGSGYEWDSRRPVNNIRSYGARGVSGAVDRAAINAAMAQSLVNEYPTYVPRGVWLTDQQIIPPPGITVMGDDATPEQCVIRASTSAIASVWAVHNTDASDATVTALRNIFKNFTLDGAGLAPPCLDVGSFLTRWECVTFENSPIDGERACRNRQAGTLSSVTATVPGGSPSGVTVSQLDPRFLFLQIAGATHIVLKVAGGGTGFVLSLDNGVTFALYQQRIVAGGTVNLLQTSSTSAQGTIGIRVTFPPGTYHDNDTYAFTATTPTEDGATNECINTDNRYIDCVWQNNGTIYGTAGVLGRFADQPRLVSISGTATVTSGSQVISIVSGTAGMSTIVREGDVLLVNNVYFGICGMSDDGQVIVPAGATPTFSGSGFDYALFVGAGRREDAGAENQRANIYNGRARFNPVNFRFSGQHGPTVFQVRHELFGAVAQVLGSSLQQQSRSATLIEPHVEAGDSGFESIYIWPGTSSVRVVEPPEHWIYPSSASFGQQRLLLQGNEFAIAGGATSSVPIYAYRFIVTSVILAAASQQFNVPTFTQIGQSTDIQFAGTANFTSTAAPLFNGLGTLQDGTILQLTNNGSTWLVIRHDIFTSSGCLLTAPYVVIGGGGGWIRFRVASGKAVEIARSNPYGASHGNDGTPGPNMVVTSNNTPTLVYDFDCVLPGLSAGTNIVWDMVAQSQDGTNNASWLGWTAMVSRTGTTAVITAVISGTTILDAGATALGWAQTWQLNGVNQIFQILGTGDNSGNPVTWKLVPRPFSAGT